MLTREILVRLGSVDLMLVIRVRRSAWGDSMRGGDGGGEGGRTNFCAAAPSRDRSDSAGGGSGRIEGSCSSAC
jgi:hypothetical protein